MIRICELGLQDKGERTRVSAMIDIDGERSPLWFEVDQKYAAFLCYERSDAFVLALLHFAMRYGHDIVCETPMSQSVYNGLVRQFLPAFYKANVGHCHPCVITAPVDSDLRSGVSSDVIATGVSCGVDSMHVFMQHPEITHACIWKGHGKVYGETAQMRESAWSSLQVQAQRFAQKVGVQLIVGDSNFDGGCTPKMMWEGMTTNGNLFNIFCLQKLWKKYFVASDCASDKFKFSILLSEDPAHYEYFLFPFLKTEAFSIEMDGADCKRIEKIEHLKDYLPAQEFLNTCWKMNEGHRNCSNGCPKCMRTMLGLWCFGALEKFSSVYDVAYFSTHFHEYYAEYLRGSLHGDFFATELKPYIKRMHIGAADYLKAYALVVKKASQKILRLGKTSYRFSSK